LRENNEKPTKGFCKLGRNVSTVDEFDQILDTEGNAFISLENREKHITAFIGTFIAKKLDRHIKFFSPKQN
jgi:hypothetical protein